MYKDLIGVPFKDNGRTLEGLDCYGLVKEVFHRFGKDIEEYSYCVQDDKQINGLFREGTSERWREVDAGKEDIPVPALIGIRFNAPKGVVNHTACYIGNGKFIHARVKTGVCIDSLNSVVWRNRIEGIYEWKGDKDG